MSDKYKNDQVALEEIKKVTGGVVPEAYFCADSGFNLGILTFLLVGPIVESILGLFIDKTYLVALARDHVKFHKSTLKII
jgi:hypothetical protein